MIAKETNYDLAIDEWKALLDGGTLPPTQQKLARCYLAGVHAEKDMAYHLKVFFGQRPEFQVFNNIKIEHDDLTAQIDHLVLTRWTAYFIESKSVSQVVTVNEHGEWGRVYNRRYTPMDSPIEQSRRHKETLYAWLQANMDSFMGNMAFGVRPRGFLKFLTPIHFVAVSPHGRIQGSGRSKFPEAVKMDQIPSRILAYHESLSTGFFSTSFADKDMEAFKKEDFAAVTEFLLREDKAQTPLEFVHGFIAQLPQEAAKAATKERDATDSDVQEAAEPSHESPAAPQCRRCRSDQIAILSGPYGYYFKCQACGGNTPIVELCPKCSGKMKVTKSGPEFSIGCGTCKTSRLYWQQPAPSPTVSQPSVTASAKAASSPPPVLPPPVSAAEVQSPVCPKCGSAMTLRTARKGTNAGSQFWGCNNYPKCRGIINV